MMGRRKKSSPAEDVIDIIAMMPWWAGVGIALLSYLFLHKLTQATPAAPVQPGQVGAMMTGALVQGLATAGQYLIPMLSLFGAGVSAFRRYTRSSLASAVASAPTIHALNAISWQQFEMLVGEAFRMKGYQIAETGGNGPDGGVDLVLRKEGEKFFVQCKQWKAQQVGVQTVRELYGVMAAHGATGGFVVTSGRFTTAATEFAAGKNMTLMPGSDLLEMIDGARQSRNIKADALAKSDQITSNQMIDAPACPQCSGLMVRRTAKKGNQTGSVFWGCASFPKCRGTHSLT